MKLKLIVILGTVCLFYAIVPVFAQDFWDPSIFIEPVSGGVLVDNTGWYAGWVVTVPSGTYDLYIYATGGENSGHWPISNVHIVVAISQAAHAGGLTSLRIKTDGFPWFPIVGFTTGPCPNLPTGGPFSEPDYYGYNQDYVLPGGLTLTSGTKTNPKTFTVEIVFSGSATEASKLAFLAYGIDAKGGEAKTPFTGQTMFMIPEIASTLMALTAFGGALGVYNLRKRGKLKT